MQTVLVEIDTLWNVKAEDNESNIVEESVEIDTLWNVKIPAKSSIKRIDLCRNRYIVECKVLFSISCISDLFVEIDTLWNVKCSMRGQGKRCLIVEIDTLWNVKIGVANIIINSEG